MCLMSIACYMVIGVLLKNFIRFFHIDYRAYRTQQTIKANNLGEL